MRYVFLGPPGVGKGTQAKGFAQRRGVPHVSTGDILREAVRAKTPVGQKAKAFMDAGKLVPDEVILEVVGERLAKPDCAGKGFVFDGFPRTLPQAEGLEKLLTTLGAQVDNVIAFTAPDDVVIERICGRLSCKCGETFHKTNRPPKKSGTCDHCGQALFQRADDTVDAVKVRLAAYKKETAPLVAFYKKRKRLTEVRADRGIEEIARDLEKIA
ncbi:MAG: adenylate kinase [Planctomycetes bacterium]|nr:adenylate kinase [Planctomycetota bacterium]